MQRVPRFSVFPALLCRMQSILPSMRLKLTGIASRPSFEGECWALQRSTSTSRHQAVVWRAKAGASPRPELPDIENSNRD